MSRATAPGLGGPATEDARLELCFVAHLAYGALTGGAAGHVGGVERQTSLMARWLAARGHRVSLVTWDEGQPDASVVDGVRVLRACRRDAGIPGLRFLHPRWTSLNAALARADARLYYQNCGEAATGQVALWAGRHGRRFVFSVASDEDCEPRLRHLPLRERVLYRLGLRGAQRVVAQTRAQQARLREHFGVDAAVLPMPCPGPSDAEYEDRNLPEAPPRVLWIGRVCAVKRPHLLLDVARACPELGFDLVGPSDGSAYARQVLADASALGNLAVHGGVPRAAVAGHYRRAAGLLCTSLYEGFPNTFLEAWSHGLPVVSSFDPDGVIAGHALGATAPDVPGLAAGLRELVASRERWRDQSLRCRRYYSETHSLDGAMAAFERLFLELSAADARGRGQ